MNAQPTQVLSPLGALQPLLDANGEIQLADMQIGERVQRYIEFAEKAKCNLPLWDTTILSQMSAGTTFIPLPVIPQESDCWQGEDAKKMKLKEGHVEPSADFHLKIANMLDIKLVKTFEGVRNDTGVDQYSVRYSAHLTLPNGAILSVEDEGKDQDICNSFGRQAHIVESTRKKAKRNAIKALLGIPTTMKVEQFQRPWILLRPVFREGLSDETDRIIAEQRALAEESKRKLFPTQIIDVKAQEVVDIEAMIAAIESANTKDELSTVQKRLASARMTQDERIQLGGLFKAKKQLLETGEITTDSQNQVDVVSPPPPTQEPGGGEF